MTTYYTLVLWFALASQPGALIPQEFAQFKKQSDCLAAMVVVQSKAQEYKQKPIGYSCTKVVPNL